MRIALFLRGINVGGVVVKSADLRALLFDAGLGNPSTILASGNVIVDGTSLRSSRARAERALSERYNRSISVVPVSLGTLEAVVTNYPFLEHDGVTPYIVFGNDRSVLEQLATVDTPEQVMLHSHVLYWSNPKGSTTDSPFAKAITKIGGTTVTTRNLRTLRKVLAAG